MKIFKDYEIKNESTFKIGGIVKEAAFPETLEELLSIVNEYDLVLGNCSNVLFSSDFINKKIIITKNINGLKTEGEGIEVYCGTKGPYAASEAQKAGLCGFEFLAGFPGSFGGMICMNASAHNQAISDTFVSADIYDLKNKKKITLYKNDMKFGYRNSSISDGNYIMLKAKFRLNKGNREKIKEIMQRNVEFRRTRQPSLVHGNAGSIFKNPPNDSAGRLLDLCEFKGVREGGAAVFDKHANFIINENNADSKDVLTLMNKMYSKVKEKYTIELEPEIKYIGDREKEEYKLWEQITKNTQKMPK